MATQTQNIVITVTQTGAQAAGQAISGVGTSAQKSSDSVKMLQDALKGLGALLVVDQLKEWVDVWVRATGLVNIFSKSQAETNLVLQKLYDISQNTRQSLEAVVKTYHQMAIAGQQLGATQNDILKVSQLVNQAFAIQGTPANVAKAGILQLSHAFSEGIVRGRQFNSLLIEMPRVLQIAANYIEGAGGSVGKLRQMMLAGKLTSADLFQALVKGSQDLDGQFQKTGKTFAQAFIVMENALIRFFGQMSQASGFSQGFYNIMKLLADNIDTVVKSLLAMASPFILQGLLGIVNAFKAMAVAAAANPIGAIITALTVATTAAILFKDQIILNQDEQLTLGDYISAVGGLIKDVFGDVGPQHVNVFKAAILGLEDAIHTVSRDFLDLKARIMGASAVDANADAQSRQEQFNRLLQQKIDLEQHIALIEGKPAPIRWLMTSELEETKSKLQDTIGMMMKAQDEQKKLLTGQSVGAPKPKGTAGDGLIADLTKRAKARKEERQKELADELKQQKDAVAELNKPLGETQDFIGEGKGKKAPKNPLDNPYKLQTAYTALLNKIQPLSGAVQEYARAQDILDREQKAGNITAERKAQLLELVKNHYRDIVDPIGAVTRQMDRENAYLLQNSEARQVSQKQYQIEENLRKQGIFLSQQETEQLKAQIVANQELARVTQQKDAIFSSVMQQQRQYIDLLKAADQLEKNKDLTKGQTDQYLLTKGPNADLFAGTKEAIEANKQQFTDMYSYIDSLQERQTISSQTASIARVRVFAQEQATVMQGYSNFFGQLAQLRTADGKKGSKIAKAAAIAQASINAYTSATGAYASASAIPIIGWVLGPIAAAAALAAGLANVAQIRSQSAGFMMGGYTGNMGAMDEAGPVHGREYVMDQMTTSRIGVHNLDDLRSGQAHVVRGGEQNQAPVVNVAPAQLSVAVVSSREEAMNALRSEEGQAFIVETMAKNSQTLTRLAGG
ncbi:MAG TPA: tape measure protein [Nitrospira sp.]|nr:tape measure protein [Nitrospira sp.]